MQKINYGLIVSDFDGTLVCHDGTIPQENKDEIAQYSSAFDTVTTNIADIKGVTDYAAEIDEATQKSCETQTKIQKWNTTNAWIAMSSMAVATATFAPQAAIAAWVVVIIGAVFIGLAVAAALMGKKSTEEQSQWAQEADKEVVLRQKTETANTNAQENLETGIENYNVVKGDIETRTVLSPNDLLVPEEGNTNTNNPFGDNGSNSDEDKDDKPKFLS